MASVAEKVDAGREETVAEDGNHVDGSPPDETWEIAPGIKFAIPPSYDTLTQRLGLPKYEEVALDESLLKRKMTSAFVAQLMALPKTKGSVQQPTYPSIENGDPANPNEEKEKAAQGKGEAHEAKGTPPHKIEELEQKPSGPIDVRDIIGGGKSRREGDVDDNCFTIQLYFSEKGLDDDDVLPKSGYRHGRGGGGDGWRTFRRGKGDDVDDDLGNAKRSKRKKKVVVKTPEQIEKEENERIHKYWGILVRRDVPKHCRMFMAYHKKQRGEAKRMAEVCQREVKNQIAKTDRMIKLSQNRMRRIVRELVIFNRKRDREKSVVKKQNYKELAEIRKREEEERERKRQQQRLNFLLTQTELYSHFMASKMNGSEAKAMTVEEEEEEEEDPEVKALAEQAKLQAENAVKLNGIRTKTFDADVAAHRGGAAPEALDVPSTSDIKQPACLRAQLKQYQLKGLQWLVSLYEQGINGILADEMGLGKTIQAISFLAHLAEEKGIWGPFLVIAPSSTLHNWASEIKKFCPNLKLLPYWGGANERKIFRKNFHPKKLYSKDAAFHVCITSYQLIVQDEKYLRRVKWQNMVLDEAQNIKSSQSQRWQLLLSFHCRNRLLLTGTPVQNSMAELWALLHFIMPTLFDNHQQFNEWFSKGIEAHAADGGGLNEHELKRLHAVLQPFMLRRVKADVENEMPKKIEVTILCDLSARQRSLYRFLKKKVSIADLIKNENFNEQGVQNLMNILAQLRKVCNHPELFEEQETRTPLQFSSSSLAPPRGDSVVATRGSIINVMHWGYKSPIHLTLPKLIFREGSDSAPLAVSGSPQGFRRQWLFSRFSIFAADNVYYSNVPHCDPGKNTKDSSRNSISGCMGFFRLLGMSPDDVEAVCHGDVLERWAYERRWRRLRKSQRFYFSMSGKETGGRWCPPPLTIQSAVQTTSTLRRRLECGDSTGIIEPALMSVRDRLLAMGRLLRQVRGYIPAVKAPYPEISCRDTSLLLQSRTALDGGWQRKLLTGSWPAPIASFSPRGIKELSSRNLPPRPLMTPIFQHFGGQPDVSLNLYNLAKALTDSGKLLALDKLLKRLRSEGHRVLIFCQMTRMMNIVEDYLLFKRYRYFRLDGSTGVSERRDLVREYQENDEIFIFLLSTRAGGLGINLTAADTVIFYESDWNPTMDLQAMDRAHRLGQTRDVTVYRLLCRGTIEEKIVKRANQKNTVQQLVMTGGDARTEAFEPEEALSLLVDDDAEMQEQILQVAKKKSRKKTGWGKTAKLKDSHPKNEAATPKKPSTKRPRPPDTAGNDHVGGQVNGNGSIIDQSPVPKKNRSTTQ